MMFSRPADCGARLHPSLVRRHDWLFWRDCAPQSADLLDFIPSSDIAMDIAMSLLLTKPNQQSMRNWRDQL
jgi:hypothetical protein